MQVYPRESLEYLPVPVDAPVDVDTFEVEMAVKPYPDRPVDADWHPADWGTAGGQTVAQILIGPDSPDVGALTPGTYVPYVRITANPEEPVIEGRPIKIG